MNHIVRAAFRANSIRAVLTKHMLPITNKTSRQNVQLSRNLWSLCSNNNSFADNQKHGKSCICGCNTKLQTRKAHTKAEKDLVEFLTEEILAERKAQKVKTIPTEIDGFQANLNGAEVTLTKKVDNETIKISFNVNHTVDTDVEPEIHPNMDKPEMGELKSKPAFKIELVRGNTTVSLMCSFIEPNEQEEGYNDVFGIDEVSIYEGTWNDNVYAVSGDVIDSYLYDLLMNYLEEKGISNEFAEKLANYSTAYEHSAYISLLEGLSKFASGK